MNRLNHHGAAHWNGWEWTIHDIAFLRIGSSDHLKDVIAPVDAVFGFASDNVIFSCAHQAQRWDGHRFTTDTNSHDAITGPVLQIWGSSDRDVYFVGGKGYTGDNFVVHHDGREYRRIEPGFEDDITDIWGVDDTALCIASDWLFDATPTKKSCDW